MQHLETLRDHLSSIISAEKYNNEDAIRQVLDDLEEIDSLDLTKDMLIKTKIALQINKLQKLPKNSEIKQKAAALFTKIGLIMKSQAPAAKKLEKASSSEAERVNHRRLFQAQLVKKHDSQPDLYPTHDKSFFESLAAQIEEELHRLDDENEKFSFLINTISDPTKDAAFNLKHRLLTSELSPKEFVRLTSDDLITNEEAADRERIRKEKMNEILVPQPIAQKSAFFQCGKCKSNNVSTYALQTRSADEPMTQFCTCCNCGNKWRQ